MEGKVRRKCETGSLNAEAVVVDGRNVHGDLVYGRQWRLSFLWPVRNGMEQLMEKVYDSPLFSSFPLYAFHVRTGVLRQTRYFCGGTSNMNGVCQTSAIPRGPRAAVQASSALLHMDHQREPSSISPLVTSAPERVGKRTSKLTDVSHPHARRCA